MSDWNVRTVPSLMPNGAEDTALLRILDANLDRAREGLRIVEEWCRFGLENGDLTAECKDLRQELARWHSPQMRAARNTPTDPGTALTHVGEQQRSNLGAVLQANLCRVQEALRVIEEYGKLESPELGEAAKQMRYRTYSLESRLVLRDRRQQLLSARLYLVTSPSNRLLETVEAALRGGLRLVQYREKEAHDGHRLWEAQQLCELCHRYGALFLVNDRVDLALAVGADGVHLGQSDLPVAVARQLLGPDRLIGCSTTHPEELHRALAAEPDYVGVGPVYETPTKPGKAAAGLDYVNYAAHHCAIPWYAIGGIDSQNLPAVTGAGATRVALVRSLMGADRPAELAQWMVAHLAIAAA